MRREETFDGGNDAVRRNYIKKGDETTSGGVVLEGIESCYHHGTELSHLHAQVFCPRCKRTGTIAPSGPRWPGTMMGKTPALEGDLCLCGCEPPPVLIASQSDMAQTFDSQALTKMGFGAAGVGAVAAAATLSGAQEEEEEDVPAEAPVTSPAQDRRQPDCSYLDGSRKRIGAPASLYRHTNATTVSNPKDVTFNFPGGGSAPAREYDATVNGHPVAIFAAAQAPASGYGVVDANTVAKALEVLPVQQYKDLGRISLNAQANPEDRIWQTTYHDPTFYSAATATKEQGVALYPWKDWNTFPQQYIDSTLLHETGHIWSESVWQEPGMKQAWLDAIASDGAKPSEYAAENPNEDFAETANMYWSSKGTPCEAEGRRRYPARYTYFDRISH